MHNDLQLLFGSQLHLHIIPQSRLVTQHVTFKGASTSLQVSTSEPATTTSLGSLLSAVSMLVQLVLYLRDDEC